MADSLSARALSGRADRGPGGGHRTVYRLPVTDWSSLPCIARVTDDCAKEFRSTCGRDLGEPPPAADRYKRVLLQHFMRRRWRSAPPLFSRLWHLRIRAAFSGTGSDEAADGKSQSAINLKPLRKRPVRLLALHVNFSQIISGSDLRFYGL